MPAQAFPLSAPSINIVVGPNSARLGWNGSLGQFDPVLTDGEGDVYLRSVQIDTWLGGGMWVDVNRTDSDVTPPTVVNLSDLFHSQGEVRMEFGGTTLLIDSDAIAGDTGDPYAWAATSADVYALIDAIGSSAGARIIFDDNSGATVAFGAGLVGSIGGIATVDRLATATLNAGLTGSILAETDKHAVITMNAGLVGSIKGDPIIPLDATASLTGGLDGEIAGAPSLGIRVARLTMTGGLDGSVGSRAILDKTASVGFDGGLRGLLGSRPVLDNVTRVSLLAGLSGDLVAGRANNFSLPLTLTGGLRGRIAVSTSLGLLPEQKRRLSASADLLIDQWHDPQAPVLNRMLRIFLDAVQEGVLLASDEYEEMRHLSSAAGIWMDRIGERLGLERPTIVDQGVAFGFGDAGQSFDQARMADAGPVQPLSPVGDELYRRLLRARALRLLTYGSLEYLRAAVAEIDPEAVVLDLDNMSFRVTTGRTEDMLLADRVQALPRPAGVRMVVVSTGLFGFDDSGVAFDQGQMRSAS